MRTCQRWEHELALPVHRVHNKKRDMVHAFVHELDAWLRSGGGARALAEAREADSGEVLAVTPQAQSSASAQFADAPALAIDAMDTPLEPARHRGNDPGNGTRRAALEAAPSASSQSVRPAAATRTHPWLRRAAAIVLLLAGGATIAAVLREPMIRARAWFSPPAPERIHVGQKLLTVYDKDGRQLWTHDFKMDLEPLAYENNKKSGGDLPYAEVHDLDGDGRKEVLFVLRTPTNSEEQHIFYCFNSDGSPRWTRERKHKVRFGDQDYLPPIIPRGFVVTSEPDGSKMVWLTMTQQPEFPEVVEKLNHQGKILAEFWHGGHVRTMKEGQVNGKRVMFVGYVENDGRRASLAVLDYENPGGFAPAENDYYRCTSCTPGQPLAFFIFPRLELGRAYNSMPLVEDMFVSPEGVQVVVRQTQPSNHEGFSASGVHYKLDTRLNFLDAFHDVGHEEVHAHLEMTGVIKHKYSRSEECDLFPVLSWNGTKFIPITAPPNFAAVRKHAAPNRAKASPAPRSVPAPASRSIQP